MVRLTALGPDSLIVSPLCGSCPHSSAGCCVAPPPLDWSDMARIVGHGGRDWLLEEMREGRLRPIDAGLAILRRKGRAKSGGPSVMKCTYHTERGCSIPHDRRAATCNYYVCDAALEGPGPEASSARSLHESLVRMFSQWDKQLTRRIRATWPSGPTYDGTFLDWLHAEFEHVQNRPMAD